MSISRPFDPVTVLLWGDRWWFAGTDAPAEFSTLAQAAEVLAVHFPKKTRPGRLRLVFQPDTLETVETSCPNGNRAALGAALAAEFPALGEPDCAWSHEPVIAADGRFSTLLHFEAKPGLFQLVDRLARSGFIVESAWPLATWLNALPVEWSETGAITVAAAAPGRALAWHHPADGKRTVKSWSGDSARTDLAAWLAAEAKRCPGQPILIIGPDDGGPEASIPGVEQVTFADALAQPVVLPKKHPAQLLPPAPVATFQRAALAASLALLLAGSWSGFGYARELMAAGSRAQASAAEKQVLRAEIARCRANAPEIALLRASLAGPGSSPPATELLEKLGGTIPRQVALRRIRIEPGRFQVEGHVAPGTAPDALAGWLTRLAGSHWSLDAPAPASATGEFRLTGAFMP